MRVTGVSPSDPLTRARAARLAGAAPSQPIRVIHAINSLGSGIWDAVGADLHTAAWRSTSGDRCGAGCRHGTVRTATPPIGLAHTCAT